MSRRMRTSETSEQVPKRSRRDIQREAAQNSISQFARTTTTTATSSGTVSSSTPTGITVSNDSAEAWPGPFSTARQMIAEREEARLARIHAMTNPLNDTMTIIPEEDRDMYDDILQNLHWKPRVDIQVCTQHIPRLVDLCISTVVEYFDHVVELGEMSQDVRSKIITELSIHRKLTSDAMKKALDISTPMHLILPECSHISEEAFIFVFEKYQNHELKGLQLSNCGFGFTDKSSSVLSHIAGSIEVLALTGTYRWSDDSIAMLLSTCPHIRDLDLSACCRLANKSLTALLNISGLCSITLDHIPQLTNNDIEQLKRLKQLQQVSLVGLTVLNDETIVTVLESVGHGLRHLNLSGCINLSDESLLSIKENCNKIQFLNISLLNKLSTDAILVFFNNDSRLGSLETLLLKGIGGMSDAAVILLCLGYGNKLIHLDLSSCAGVTGKSMIALARHCKQLQRLDVSFVRGVKEDALGALVESVSTLRWLGVWGSSAQLTQHFHTACRREGLIVEGLLPVMASSN
jgi:hypothetical protein